MNNEEIKQLRFWCQKILPLVYDDSLSYYEVLCKVSAKLNEVITGTNNLSVEFNEFYAWISEEIKKAGTLSGVNQIESDCAHTSVYNKQIAMLDADGQLFGDSININDIMIKPRRTANNAIACFDDNGRLAPLCFDENTPLVTLNKLMIQEYFYDQANDDCALTLSNGFKICYGSFKLENITPTQVGSTVFYRSNNTINHLFKYEFQRTPKVTISPTIGNLDNVCWVGGCTYDNTKILRVNVMTYLATTISPEFNYVAIGY